MAWSTPKTDWAVNDAVHVDDFNRIEGNIDYLKSVLNTATVIPCDEYADITNGFGIEFVTPGATPPTFDASDLYWMSIGGKFVSVFGAISISAASADNYGGIRLIPKGTFDWLRPSGTERHWGNGYMSIASTLTKYLPLIEAFDGGIDIYDISEADRKYISFMFSVIYPFTGSLPG